MAKVAIVTDSTACIPAEYISKYPIVVIPLHVIFGSQIYMDGVDMTTNQFYKKLVESKINPTTSQPTPDAFEKEFKRFMEEGYDVISINISSKLSGTVDSATQAKNHLATSRNALFTVATLEFLHRGGRIGSAAAFFGTTLDLKPLLELRNGRIEPVARVRTFSKAIDQMVSNFEKQVNHKKPLRLVTLHANALEDAVNLLTRLKENFEISESFVSEISPVLGTHVGPGTVGIGFMAGL